MGAILQNFVNKYIWETGSERAVNLENPKAPISGWLLDQILGGNVSKNGRSVSAEGALTLSAFYRATAIKSGIISSLPFQPFRKTSSGRQLATDHPSYELLTKRPNPKMTKNTFFERGMMHYEVEGEHFAYIRRNGLGIATRFDLLCKEDVRDVRETDDDILYKIKGIEDWVRSENMIHVPNMGTGIRGKSVLRYMKEDASLMFDIRDYGMSFFGKGGKPAGLLIPKGVVTNPQRLETKKSFQEAKMEGGDVALPLGWDYKEISVPPAEAAWVASNDFTISDIARWTGVPEQKLGKSDVKYSNVEWLGIEFLQDTMTPIATKFQQEYTNKLYQLPSESNIYTEFNLDAYIRADSVTKAELFSKYVQNSLKTPDEIRALNNDPAMGGNAGKLWMQGATVPIDLAGQQNQPKDPKSRQSLRKKIEKQVQDGMDPQLIIEGLFGNDGKGY